ncbi:MAG TPA: hypothetical protein PLJ37_00970 [Chitinophagales bacterium]|nr:hypothetical protein [Chitinophagales bacterium]HMW93399.1 hypothetical protein [Chitinophagales bacterium]HMZ92979.1 hypothetical protein [Chitinophagales bacterium]HNG25958.1 hypothetical protein [Chitinophagales bacterium]
MIEINFGLSYKVRELYLTLTPMQLDISNIHTFSEKFSSKIDDSLLETLGDEIYNAISLLTDYKTVATSFFDFVKLKYEKASGSAYFDRAPLFLQTRDVKYSSAACEKYISIDEESNNLRDIMNQWNVFRSWLDDKRRDFYEKLLWIKKKIELMKKINNDIL